MKKEREMIAKNNGKKFFVFILLAVLVGLPTWFTFLRNPELRWVGIWFVSVVIFTSLFCLLILIILPKYAIVKQDDKIIISVGILKETILISTVISVEVAPLKEGSVVSKNGNILIKIKNENEEEKVFTVNVKNKEEVVERLNLLINNFLR